MLWLEASFISTLALVQLALPQGCAYLILKMKVKNVLDFSKIARIGTKHRIKKEKYKIT